MEDVANISKAEASISEEASREMFLQYWSFPEKEDYVYYHLDDQEVIYNLCNTFINNHAYVNYGVGPYISPTPKVVYRFNSQDWIVEGALYDNGCIYMVGMGDDPARYYFLCVAKNTHEIYKYPQPAKYKTDIRIEDT